MSDFCADATPQLTSNEAAATNSDCFLTILLLCRRFPRQTSLSSSSTSRGSSRAGTFIYCAELPDQSTQEADMKIVIGCAAILLALATVTTANAKGCLKGAVVGGTAGHFAGHHGVLGAAAGCVIGRHEANKRARMQNSQTRQGGGRL
jgi:hypothetical protein